MTVIRDCMDSAFFKMVSKSLGFMHSYCTFTPMKSTGKGFIAFHWYENFEWKAATCTMGTYEVWSYVLDGATTLFDAIMRETEAHV